MVQRREKWCGEEKHGAEKRRSGAEKRNMVRRREKWCGEEKHLPFLNVTVACHCH